MSSWYFSEYSIRDVMLTSRSGAFLLDHGNTTIERLHENAKLEMSARRNDEFDTSCASGSGRTGFTLRLRKRVRLQQLHLLSYTLFISGMYFTLIQGIWVFIDKLLK